MTLRLADYLKWGPRDESKQDRGLSSAREKLGGVQIWPSQVRVDVALSVSVESLHLTHPNARNPPPGPPSHYFPNFDPRFFRARLTR